MAKATRDFTRGEERVLRAIASGAEGTECRRAQAILHWATERDLDQAASASGLRPAQVRYWVAAFGRSRLGVFSQALLAQVRDAAPMVPRADGPVGAIDPTGGPAPDVPTGGLRKTVRSRRPRIRGIDPMAEALRKVLAFHFARVKKLEGAAFEAEEEAVHDMRVAIRRLRAALRIARPFFRRKVLRPLRTELQAAAQALGALRDLDVLLANACASAPPHPAGPDGLKGWIEHLQTRRRDAHRGLQEHLTAKRYLRFRKDFLAFLAEGRTAAGAAGDPTGQRDLGSDGSAGARGPVRVCDVIPAAIWTQYANVRAHETLQEPSIEALHLLRIEIKRFRYLLEFFEGTLGRRLRPLIEMTIRLQDHLGRLHDAWIAAGLLRTYLANELLPQGGDLTGTAAYLSALQSEMETLRTAFPAVWQELVGRPMRMRLARLLARI